MLPANPFSGASKIIQPTDSRQSDPEFGPVSRSGSGVPGTQREEEWYSSYLHVTQRLEPKGAALGLSSCLFKKRRYLGFVDPTACNTRIADERTSVAISSLSGLPIYGGLDCIVSSILRIDLNFRDAYGLFCY